MSRFTKHELFACSPRGRSALRSPSEAVVLFEFLSRSAEHQRFAHSSEEPPRFEIVDQAEQRALWNLEATFESILVEPLDPNWDEFLAEAAAGSGIVGRPRLEHAACNRGAARGRSQTELG